MLAWNLFGSDGLRRQFGSQLAQAGPGQLRPFQANLDQLRLAQAKRQPFWISSAAGGSKGRTPPPAAGAMWPPVSISHRWPNEAWFLLGKCSFGNFLVPTASRGNLEANLELSSWPPAATQLECYNLSRRRRSAAGGSNKRARRRQLQVRCGRQFPFPIVGRRRSNFY